MLESPAVDLSCLAHYFDLTLVREFVESAGCGDILSKLHPDDQPLSAELTA
jgi:hypothetical protein